MGQKATITVWDIVRELMDDTRAVEELVERNLSLEMRNPGTEYDRPLSVIMLNHRPRREGEKGDESKQFNHAPRAIKRIHFCNGNKNKP